MKVALVHDWLTGMRGGERVLEVLCDLYPAADVFTLVYVPGSVSARIERHRIVPSYLQRVPGIKRRYRYALPLMPSAVEAFDLSEYDLVIASSHCVAKGAITRPDARFLAYLHTPMRYIWDMWPKYFPRTKWIHRTVTPHLLSYLRSWDVTSSARVDSFAANSHFVKRRIEKFYRRDARVIHPPIDVEFFGAERRPRKEQYLMVSALVPSKGIELAIETFNRLNKRLLIVGTGPLEKKLRALAGSTVELCGWLSENELRRAYAESKALIHTAVEDFGMSPLEAQAAGLPVVALGRGGSLETVVPLNRPWNHNAQGELGPTGVLFFEETPEALADAIDTLERELEHLDERAARSWAGRFTRSSFESQIRAWVAAELHGPEAETAPGASARTMAQSDA